MCVKWADLPTGPWPRHLLGELQLDAGTAAASVGTSAASLARPTLRHICGVVSLESPVAGAMREHRLEPIALAELPDLRDLYAEGGEHTFTFNLLHNYCGLLERRPDLGELAAYSLDGDWRSDGLFLIQFKNYLHFDSLAPDDGGVRAALGLLDFRGRGRRQVIAFNGYAERFQEAVEDVMRRNHLWTDGELNGSYDYFELPTAGVRTLETRPLPGGFRLEQLRREHADQVNEAWLSRHEGSLELIRSYIEHGTGLGVFAAGTGELVAWAMVQLVGAVGVLHVTPDCRQLGLGSQLVAELARRMHGQGLRVAATIAPWNVASRKLFSKLGFRQESARRFNWTYVWPGGSLEEVEGILGG